VRGTDADEMHSRTIEDNWQRRAVHRLADELRRHHQPTAEHSHRLARAARSLAVRLGLDALQATESELVAIVHDVGKLAVPGALLDHAGRLTDAQRDVLRGHAVAGAEILTQRAGLEHLAPAVRHVHEAWDGSGYPDGLAGEEIPLLARIVCVVDAYDAMTHDRAYRRALTPVEARVRLAVAAGRQFDRTIATAYLDELHAQAPRFTRPVGPVGPVGPVV
jgi:HD-GYP domain-containing protein (c-di-GMP phosphodiesterase class II)